MATDTPSPDGAPGGAASATDAAVAAAALAADAPVPAASGPPAILIVLTSHAVLGEVGSTTERTGLWLEELAAPWYVFGDAGAQLTLASPAGGPVPLDPRSLEEAALTPATRRFQADPVAQEAMAHTLPLAAVDGEGFDAVFYPGGHGPLWDLANSPTSVALLERTLAAGRPLGLVCHAPGALRLARTPGGAPLVQGRRVTGFSDAEEDAVGLSGRVPFSVEQMLRHAGGQYVEAPPFEPHVVVDGDLVTGQNPASSGPAAQALLQLLAARRR